jgi:hypothetical protein
VLFFVIPNVLIFLSYPGLRSGVDLLVTWIFYSFGFGVSIFIPLNFYSNKANIEKLMKKISRDTLKNAEIQKEIEKPCRNAKILSIFLCVIAFSVMNMIFMLYPIKSNHLVMPMLDLSLYSQNPVIFWFFWAYQLLCLNYFLILVYPMITLSFSIMILMEGNCQYFNWRLSVINKSPHGFEDLNRNLWSSRDGFMEIVQ